jgi:hypothetical protein
MKNAVVLLVIFFAAIAACRQSPNSAQTTDEQAIGVLKSSRNLTQSNFGLGFWNEQRKNNTPLWQQGIAWCSEPDHKNLQNCQQLRTVLAEAFMPPPISEPTESFGLLPHDKKQH